MPLVETRSVYDRLCELVKNKIRESPKHCFPVVLMDLEIMGTNHKSDWKKSET